MGKKKKTQTGRPVTSDHNDCDQLFRKCMGWTAVPERHDRGNAGGDRESFLGL